VAQHLEALERANEVRLARAALKREIKAGQVALGDYLAEPDLPDWLDGMPLEELLGALPGLRRSRIGEWMHEVPINRGALIRALTYRKRRILAAQVQGWERHAADRAQRRARASIGNERHPGNSRNSFRVARRVA
jgi:hypothetical protein